MTTTHAGLSEAQLKLLPTDEDVRFYREHGYYLSKKIIPDEVLDAAERGAERFYRGERDRALPRELNEWTADKGDVLRKNDFTSLRVKELYDLVTFPLIGAVAAKLSGSDVIRLWHDQLLYKPVDRPEQKANVGWHTDRHYWGPCSSDNMLTAWVPFHDCDEAMGTIAMVDGSHTWPANAGDALNFFSSDLDALEKNFNSGGKAVVKVPANLKRGEVSFHHCLTIHGSGPNRSGRPRRSMAIHLQDGGNRWRRFQKPNKERPERHPNDTLVRADAQGNPDYTDPAICPVLWPR